MPIEGLAIGAKLLHGRYTLDEHLSSSPNLDIWTAYDGFDTKYLLKIWRFSGEHPDAVVRALWDRELRYLFRLSSAPQSETRVLVLRDAGIDKEYRSYVMALKAPGYTPLRVLLDTRKDFDWLRELRSSQTRSALWKAVKQLALGLQYLHEQQMLHRNISSLSVFTDPDAGPESMRLGGFEWTIKVGTLHLAIHPPEFAGEEEARASHTFESDWFSFGGLAAEIFIPSLGHLEPLSYSSVLTAIEESQVLSPEESTVLLRLLDDKPESRLSHGVDVLSELDRIISYLDQPPRLLDGCHLGLIVTLAPGQPLTQAIVEEEPTINAIDIEAQRAFIERDLRRPLVIRKDNAVQETYVLLGNRLGYLVTEFNSSRSAKKGQWDLAFCNRDADLRYSNGMDDQRELRQAPVRVFTFAAARRDAAIVNTNAISWGRFLPRPNAQRKIEERQRAFHDFFRITNQIELLFRDAEIFGYTILDRSTVDGVDYVTLRERPRPREPLGFAQIPGGLLEFLRRQIADTVEGDRVYLGPEEGLALPRRDRGYFWTVTSMNPEEQVVKCRRVCANIPPLETEGFLRSSDLFGEISLIRRRKRAIDRLKSHSFLLESLLRPDQVYVDTGVEELPAKIDPTNVDPAKRRALHQIWRTHPIYALQGPPGTGKTTLIAHLLGQIFADDPVAQVLVTAQAHAAVDVLREKVAAEIFEKFEADERPLAIRLPRSKGHIDDDQDSVAVVTRRMLERAEAKIDESNEVARRWLVYVRQAISELKSATSIGGITSGLCELVRRSASITYSSTTAGNLEELADSTLSFDWSVIEEAGKAHGFDLVLPLQTGHRWLLIGDQNQLPPYRYKDFDEGLRGVNDVMAALGELPERAGGLVDMDLLLGWRQLKPNPDGKPDGSSQEERKELWRRWLQTFKAIHETCTRATKVDSPSGTPLTPIASMLSHQHRMHPTIAELISRAYYKEPLISETQVAGAPIERVIHPFIEPESIIGKSILWLDLPWVGNGDEGEIGPPNHLPYIAPAEIQAIKRLLHSLKAREGAELTPLKVAVLSPYRQQVKSLQEELRSIQENAPSWMQGIATQKQVASTVDSYQGNQADVVIVSLVRNNRNKPSEGLGFLSEAARMNVLFSRAEKLLVLVGSWQFFQHQMAGTAADRNQPLGHWRLALDFLESAFDSGHAVKLDITELKYL